MQTSAYTGGATDGRYLYAAPWRGDRDEGRCHGRLLRYDTLEAGSFSLRYGDYGHNGGLCAAVPGPSFLINTDSGPRSISAHQTLQPGWHHLAGTYDGGRLRLFVDGRPVAERRARGCLQLHAWGYRCRSPGRWGRTFQRHHPPVADKRRRPRRSLDRRRMQRHPRKPGGRIGGPSMSEIDVRQTQLFLDDEIIEFQTLLERVVHQPARHSENPVLRPEMPWEIPTLSFIAGVYPDPVAGGYRAWYVTHPTAFEGSMFCTATSDDGVHWVRPELDICRDVVGGPSNVLYASELNWDGPTVLHDPDDQERPWKLIFYQQRTVCVGTSPDGLHWTIPGPEDPLLPGFGDRTTALLNPGADEPYVILSRDIHDMHQNQGVRCVWRAGSRDARTISTPARLALRPDLEDGPYIELYQMGAFKYESVFIGMIERYHTVEPPFGDIELTLSRDTHTWNRLRPRRTFFAPPTNGREFGAFDYSISTPANSPPIHCSNGNTDELRFYYYGGPTFHGDRFMAGHNRCMGLAKLRLDGFVSLRAHRREGCVTTRPFSWPGGRLTVNSRVEGGILWTYDQLETSDGWVRVEVLDPEGRVVEGLSRSECDPLFADGVAAEVTWSGSQDFDRFAGETIALRFLLRSADLFSFRASGAPG